MKKKTSAEINEFIKANYAIMSNRELSAKIGISPEAIKKRAYSMGLLKNKTFDIPDEKLAEVELSQAKAKSEKKDVSKKYQVLLKDLDEAMKMIKVLEAPRQYSQGKIVSVNSGEQTEATAVVLLSDWHVEETVKSSMILYQNNYNLEIAKQRAEECFIGIVKLLKKEQSHQNIDTLVLGLLGDFITGNIHQEEAPNLSLGVAQAVCFAEELLIKGIQYILDNTNVKIICPCVVGNHSRITQKVYVSTEKDNSVETIIYYHIKKYFENEKRFELIMPDGPERLVDIYGLNFLFCHGHAGFRYGGGVGGLYVPLRRSIMTRYNRQQIDTVCLGHFHTYIQDSLFLVNGSMIGFSNFANYIKVAPEAPTQTFFLVDKRFKRRTVTIPISFKA